MHIRLRQEPMKRIQLAKDSEILELAKIMGVSLNSSAIGDLINFRMKSPCSEEQLKQTVKRLEEKKDRLELDFHRIALQGIKLEAKYVGTRNQIVRAYRDNRALTMHLCTYSPRNEHEGRVRERLIQKYLIDAKLM